MPHEPHRTIVTQSKPSVLPGAPSGSQIIIGGKSAFTSTTLDQLGDVDVSGQQDGDVLIFNSATGKYESGPIDGGTWTP